MVRRGREVSLASVVREREGSVFLCEFYNTRPGGGVFPVFSSFLWDLFYLVSI